MATDETKDIDKTCKELDEPEIPQGRAIVKLPDVKIRRRNGKTRLQTDCIVREPWRSWA